MKVLRSVGVVVLCAGLSGCAAYENFKYRNGPSPDLSANDLEASLKNQLNVTHKFKEIAGLSPKDSLSGDQYYAATLAGFNYVDAVCDEYMRELIAIERYRDRTNKMLDTTNAGTAAVLGLTSVASPTMAIVAQSFNLSKDLFTVSVNGYLMNSSSKTISSIIIKLQDDYKKKVEQRKDTITSDPALFAVVRGYLRVCLPSTIETKIGEAIDKLEVDSTDKPKTAKTKAAPGGSGGSATTITQRLVVSTPQ